MTWPDIRVTVLRSGELGPFSPRGERSYFPREVEGFVKAIVPDLLAAGWPRVPEGFDHQRRVSDPTA